MDSKLIEAAARAIAPRCWEVMDAELNRMLQKYKGQEVAYPSDQFQHKESMATARAAILAFLDAAAGDEVVEKVARGIYNARIAGGRNYSEFDDLCTNGFNTAYDGVMDDARAALSALKAEVKP